MSKFSIMSNANNSINKIVAQSNKLDRSASSVRFQIEKVFDDDDDGPEDSSNSKKVLDKTSSVPISKCLKKSSRNDFSFDLFGKISRLQTIQVNRRKKYFSIKRLTVLRLMNNPAPMTQSKHYRIVIIIEIYFHSHLQSQKLDQHWKHCMGRNVRQRN